MIPFLISATLTDSLVAYGTAGLALATVALAISTQRVARVAVREQRGQWRPALMAMSPEVDEIDESTLRIALHNVGKGPALGIYGQLRVAGRVASATLATPNIAVPGVAAEMQFSLPEGFDRSRPIEFRISYYDIGEWMHVTELHSKLRPGSTLEPSKNVLPLEIAKTFLSERDRQLVAIYGSPRGRQIGKRARTLRFRLWYALKYRLKGHL